MKRQASRLRGGAECLGQRLKSHARAEHKPRLPRCARIDKISGIPMAGDHPFPLFVSTLRGSLRRRQLPGLELAATSRLDRCAADAEPV